MLKNKYDFMQKITPQMRAVAEKVRAWNAAHPERVNDYRSDYLAERKFWNEGGPVMAKVEEFDVPGGPTEKVNVRLHYPTLDKNLPRMMFLLGCSASANDGMAMTNHSSSSRLDVSNGYSGVVALVVMVSTKKMIVSTMDINVFMRNSDDDF